MKALQQFAIASALLIAGVSAADAGWSRSGGGTGPRGNSWTSSGGGSCYGGSCTSSQKFTGPRGTYTRDGSTSCSGGTCSGGATYTGPAGNSVKRSRSFTVN